MSETANRRTTFNPHQSSPGGSEAGLIADWLHIEADGKVTVFTGKVEIGQNIRTSLTQAVAEELRIPLETVSLVMADTALTPFDMGTFGSRTTPTMASLLRTVAASAREILIAMAADRWHVSANELRAEHGRIIHQPSGRTIGYGVLTQGRPIEAPYDEHAPLTSPDEWSVAGVAARKVRGTAMVTGEHRYTPDITRPGMLTGKILRPPVPGATLTSLDASAAGTMPDVTVVREGDFVGVVAPDNLTATRAQAALRADWSITECPSDDGIYDYFRLHPVDTSEPPVVEVGSTELGRADAALTLNASYTIAYIAHVPMEPRAAVAEWTDDGLTVWTGTQRPFGVRGELAEAFGLDERRVRVIVPDMGSGYGGKHVGDAALEAAKLAQSVRKPIKLVWSREEEFTYAYFRPGGVIDVASGVRSDGTLASWEFHNYNSGAAGIRSPYEAPNQCIQFHLAISPLRQGSYRGLAATANHFARETHMDELAHALSLDPLAFRLLNLRDARLRAVLEAVASRFGWGQNRPSEGRGIGLACGTEKGSYVATCAEVEINPKDQQVRVIRVVQAFECGTIVNPDGLRNQIEGAIIQGLGGALFERVRFQDGRILTNRFSRYRVPRFSDAPHIETVLLDRKDLPSTGAGETPIVCIAPAIGNAIFNATGVRLRSMPLAPEGMVGRL